MSTKRENFVWKKWHEEILLAEVSTVEPYKFKFGSKERGKAWREVSDNLNALKDLGFKTTHRCVRDKFEKMLKDFEKKENEENMASGVDVEYSDIDKALEDIKGRIAEVDEEQERERKKVTKEKVAGEQMRFKAMVNLRETKKRSIAKISSKDVESDNDDADDDIQVVTPKRKRSQGSMTEILKDAMTIKKQANEIRERELELQTQEMKQNHMFFQSMLAQQQQFQQQQQAMNQAFLNALSNLTNKN